MAVPRQLKLADGCCVWCGGVVIGNHRDRRLCSKECSLMSAGFRALIVARDLGADERVLDLMYERLEARQARFDAGRVRAA